MEKVHVMESAVFQKDEASHNHRLRRRLFQMGPVRYL